MKVLHFTPYYPPDRAGGVGEFVAGLHQALRSSGHVSLVVTTGTGGREGVEAISKSALGWFFRTALWARRAREFDVVHCQAGESLPVQIALALLSSRSRPKVLTTFHLDWRGIAAAHRPYRIADRTFGRSWRPFVYRTLVTWAHLALDHLAIRLSDAVNTISAQSAREVLGVERSREARVIYYGLGELPASADGERRDALVGSIDLLYVGSGGHRKRVVALPHVLAAVCRELPSTRLCIVGFTPQSEPEVVDLFRRLRILDRVDFAGVKASGELAPYYAKARVLVVPSAYEGLPFVILEAMRSGLPVVATRVSGHPEALLDGQNGFLVSPDRPEEMAGRCLELLRDPALRQRLAAAARRTLEERFTLEREMREYLNLYQGLTATPAGPGARNPA